MSEESKAAAAGCRADAYLEMLGRLEPDIVMVDQDATLVSIAVSLKRIADAVENNSLGDAIYNAITQAAIGSRR